MGIKYNKTLQISLFITIAAMGCAYSQCLNCNTKGITTNPGNSFGNSVNTEKPAKRNTFFDWTNLGTLPVSSQFWPPPYNNISSPFNQDGNIPLSHLLENPDRMPEDGWELIKYDLGFNEDGSPKGTTTRNIYIILYNKYTGILRIFVAANEIVSYNGIRVVINFIEGTQSSLLSNASEIFALDHFEQAPSITGVAKHIPSMWMYADFSVSYDPCTCYNSSKIGITIEYLNSSTISMSGAITGNVTSTNNGSVNVEEDGYTLTDLSGAGKKAKKKYDDISKFTKDQLKALKIEGKSDIELTVEQLFKKNSLNKFQEEIKKSSFLKAGLKAAPYLGAAIELVDFFVGGGKKSSGPQEVRIMPMALQADVKLSGTIEGTYPFPGITFYTPGSKDASCGIDNQYPYYNEVLGVFNLLKTPIVNFDERANDHVDYYPGHPNYFWQHEEIKRLQLGSSIDYVLNPAAGFRSDNIEIVGSLIFKTYAGEVVYQTPFLPINSLQAYSAEFVDGFGADFYGTWNYVQGCGGRPDVASLKLLVNLTRLDATENTQNVLWVGEFPAQLQSNYQFGYSSSKFCDYTKEYSINYLLNHSISAWERITLEAGTIFGTSSITIKAPEIIVKPGVIIPPNVKLEAKPLVEGNYNHPATTINLTDYCVGPLYNSQSRAYRQKTPENLAHELSEISEFDVYPNPASSSVTFRYHNQTDGHIKLSLHNITNTQIAVLIDDEVKSGPHEVDFGISHLMPGIYLCILETEISKEVKRLVIIR